MYVHIYYDMTHVPSKYQRGRERERERKTLENVEGILARLFVKFLAPKGKEMKVRSSRMKLMK